MNSVYENGGATERDAFGSKVSDAFDRGGRFLGRIGFGLFLLLAVGATLVATTFVGVMLALAAGFLALTHKLGRKSKAKASASEQSGPPPTLEAHRTADGWVTETTRRD